MKLFLMAMGLAFFIEGMTYFISPEGMKKFLAQMLEVPDEHLRLLGFLVMASGLLIVYLGRT